MGTVTREIHFVQETRYTLVGVLGKIGTELAENLNSIHLFVANKLMHNYLLTRNDHGKNFYEKSFWVARVMFFSWGEYSFAQGCRWSGLLPATNSIFHSELKSLPRYTEECSLGVWNCNKRFQAHRPMNENVAVFGTVEPDQRIQKMLSHKCLKIDWPLDHFLLTD